MKNIYAVIGAGYGDEGKGLFTDYLSSLNQKSVVIRFNGGAQAGHTVQTVDGDRHVFGHFGANSFLKNSKTVLSRFFVVNPLLFKKEFYALQALKINPVVYCHSQAYVTTPYDMIINQLLEKKRGNTKHGSCGLGFGQTIEREEKKGVSFQFKDLFLSKERLLEKLFLVRKYFLEELTSLEIINLLSKDELMNMLTYEFMQKFQQDCTDISVMIKICDDELSVEDLEDEETQIVFEGAQGLMLDQFYGQFPHVTRSSTGLKNIVEIIKGKNVRLNVFYATRSYVTRHGAGPLSAELENKPYPGIVDNTNIDNLYQGSLRFAYLDMNILKDAIEHDLKYWLNDENNELLIGLGVSCLDQTDILKYWKDGHLLESNSEDIKKIIFKDFQFVQTILESYSATRKGIKVFLS